MWVALAPLVLLAACVLWIWRKDEARRALTKSLPTPPGEYQAPLVGMAFRLIKLTQEGKAYDWVHEKAKELGYTPFCWYTPAGAEIFLTDPKDVKHCFTTNFRNYEHVQRRPKFEIMTGGGIFTSDGKEWREHRRLALTLFTARRLAEMQGVFERKARKVAEIIAAKAGEGPWVDVQQLMFSYTFDSICEIAFGVDSGSLDGEPTGLRFQQAFDTCQRLAVQRFIKPFWEIERAMANVGLGFGSDEAVLRDEIKIVDAFAYGIINQRTAEEWGEGKDVLSVYKEQQPDVTAKELRDVAMNFIIAGRDTTAAASTWMMWELARHPEVLAKVREEVKRESGVENMQYLQAVFSETLRLSPSVPLDGKTAVGDDTLPSGIFVPAGANVGFSPWAFTKNPALYTDPEEFRPERWLEGDGTCATPDQYTFVQFNMAPRLCLGQKMAANEAKTIVAELVTAFDFELQPGYERNFFHSAVIQTRNGMPLKFTPRAEEAG